MVIEVFGRINIQPSAIENPDLQWSSTASSLLSLGKSSGAFDSGSVSSVEESVNNGDGA